MAASSAARVDVRAPAARPRRTTRAERRGLTGGVGWIILVAALLAGVVAVNVSVLRLNVRLSDLERKRATLQAENGWLEAQLSSAATPARIERFARRNGLVRADSDKTVYVSLRRGK